jgi:hypothetical protein
MTSPIQATAAPTQITISPLPEASGKGDFFGASGPGINTLIDTINPLQHIPFLSSLYQETTGDTSSTAATLIGGTLFGGVFGFLGSLASVIFEHETGHSVGGAVMAALRGETPDPNVQFASNQVNLGDFAGDARRNVCTRDCSVQEVAVAQAEPVPVDEEEVAAASIVAPAEGIQVEVAQLAIPQVPPAPVDLKQREKDRQVLSLFGASASSASAAYQKADMRAYLKDASTNLVM